MKVYPSIESDIQIAELTKSYRRNEFIDLMRENKDLVNLLQVRFIDIIDDVYPGQKIINSDYREELIKNCKYFNNLEIET